MKHIAKYTKERKGIRYYRLIVLFKPVLLFSILGIALACLMLSSCEDFFDPNQELIREEKDLYKNWTEYRAIEMGMYSNMQNLVEQIVVLGELRADLLKITEFADEDLVEVYNFNISKENKYASPTNFYKLIITCNKLIRQLESEHPNVLDKGASINNYDRLYGEALCMRAWAYFNAVRIYGKVPYVHSSLDDAEEITEYVNSGTEYRDSTFIKYAPDGYYNDTIDTLIVLEKRFLDQRAIIDTFTNELENNIKAVGVNHAINIDDLTWNVTVWNNYARHVLLGQMYMFNRNYSKAISHFNKILYNFDSETADIRFGLDDKFGTNNWQSIFTSVEPYEHIFTLWFGKSYQQTHQLQSIFSVLPPNRYMVKPTSSCIRYWESIWNDCQYDLDNVNPSNSYVVEPGVPGDFYRGYGVSYKYYKDGEEILEDTVRGMLEKKMQGNYTDVNALMDGADTVVSKFDFNRDRFAQDAHFIVYRAAGVHLYAAEIYVYWKYIYGGLPTARTNTQISHAIVNTGNFGSRRSQQLGVRGRVGFGVTPGFNDNSDEFMSFDNVKYIHDPDNNEIIGYRDLSGNPEALNNYTVNQIFEERARELAFEGERFYDLMRESKRRGDPSYLANKVAAKFDQNRRAEIREKLMNEKNWYVNYYDE